MDVFFHFLFTITISFLNYILLESLKIVTFLERRGNIICKCENIKNKDSISYLFLINIHYLLKVLDKAHKRWTDVEYNGANIVVVHSTGDV